MGKFSEKFLNAFSLKDDDEEYDEDYDYENEEEVPYETEEFAEEEPAPAKNSGLFSRTKKPAPAPAPSYREEPSRPSAHLRGNQEVCIFKPSSIEDAREITETLLQGKAVVINFEGLQVEISQRIIDFISGSCYALDGNLQKISNFIFIATPDSVDISGDFQELFDTPDNSFDVGGFKSPIL